MIDTYIYYQTGYNEANPDLAKDWYLMNTSDDFTTLLKTSYQFMQDYDSECTEVKCFLQEDDYIFSVETIKEMFPEDLI